MYIANINLLWHQCMMIIICNSQKVAVDVYVAIELEATAVII